MIKLTLTDPEITYLLSVIQEQPLKNCYALFGKIREQLIEQQEKDDNSRSTPSEE